MNQLSPLAQKAFFIIQSSLNETDSAPTIQQLSSTLGVSTRRALDVLRELEDSLVIKRSPYKSRSIEIITDIDQSGSIKDESVSVPILGTAPGGMWLFSEENFEGTLQIPARLTKGITKNIFLLRVRGNSMLPFLEDGDLALVKKYAIQEAQNGDYVVAVRESDSGGYESTIKEFNRIDGSIVLNPLNRKEHSPIIGNDETIGVHGKVIGAIKFSLPNSSL